MDPELARRIAHAWFDAWNDVCCRSIRDREAAETMFFGDDGKIVRVLAHYAASSAAVG